MSDDDRTLQNRSDDDQTPQNVSIDADNLYREETITDRKVGQIQRLAPIKADGSDDPSRSMQFNAMTNVMTPMGALPVQGAIEATTLEEAVTGFPDAVSKAIENLEQELQRRQREQASRIVVPGRDQQDNNLIV